MKLNALLARTDSLAASFKKGIVEYAKFFKDKQGAFKGERKTYTPRPETIDYPGERGVTLVQTTVAEKLKYLVDDSKDYIDALFAQERTNATGLATADVVVDGQIVFPGLTTAELLRLKTILSNTDLDTMYASLPVRSDAEQWDKVTNDEAFEASRGLYESPIQEGTRKSTIKETYILSDPNVSQLKDTSKYVPLTAVRDTPMELGDYTFQKFSGETTQTVRAGILQRKKKLLTAVTEALKQANEVEATTSVVTAEKVFGYLHGSL